MSTSVLAFLSASSAALATRTLRAIPPAIPQFHIDVPDNPSANLSALAHVFPIVLSAGHARGIDPGRPGVPAFGRQIYRINAFSTRSGTTLLHRPREVAAVERKADTPLDQLTRSGALSYWTLAYRCALAQLRSQRYSAIVFDYDGTLCDSTERFAPPRPAIVRALCELLRTPAQIGIATGRGISIRHILRRALPQTQWRSVLVGYYNGAEIARLDDDNYPDGTPKVGSDLTGVAKLLNQSRRLNHIASIAFRRHQITVTAKAPRDSDECWSLLVHSLFSNCLTHFKLVRSTHSFDILNPEVSKLTVVKSLSSSDCTAQILAIGDMGRWPGNDYELLSHRFSLSVDTVSPDPDTCWNFASPGVRGVNATLEYLSKLQVARDGQLRLALPHKNDILGG